MRILLDNCVNQRLARFITSHEVVHAREKGWAELSNGDLMRAAEADGFDVLRTVDKSIRMQKKNADWTITLITLDASSIVLGDLLEFLAGIEQALRELKASGNKGQDIVLQQPRSNA